MKKIIFSILILLISIESLSAQDNPTPVPESTWPSHYYAPYMYASGYPLAAMAKIAGVRYLTLAFILNGQQDCQAAWDGGITLEQQKLLPDELKNLRQRGGNVIISFGGAAGTELAQSCPDVESLSAQYQAVVDAYNVTRLDFDIEGDAIKDSVSIDRRSQALAALQTKAAGDGKTIDVTFTLPVSPDGLTTNGLAVLQSAIDNHVYINMVNIMTMDFGSAYPPDQMAALTIKAANSLFDQMAELFPQKTEDELWAMIGLTPMIGLNDSAPEVFTLDDATTVLQYAQDKGIGQIAIWAFNRDKSCSGNAKTISGTCSGVQQDPYAYSTIFNQFTDSD